MRRPTMRDVAETAGVAIKTVSRVVNGDPYVSAQTTTRVLLAIEELGFQRNELARSLRPGQRTSTLGLVIGDVTNPFYARVARGVEDVTESAGFAVFIGSTQEDPARERRIATALCGRRVDGLLMAPSGPTQAYLADEVARGLPVAFFDRPSADVPGDVVMSDDAHGTRLAATYLVERGHRRIALFINPDSHTGRTRRAGMEAALAALGAAGSAVLADVATGAQAAAATRDLFTRPDPPTAIFATNAVDMVAALHALQDLAVSPERVGLASFDNFEAAGLLPYSVAVIEHDPVEMGRRCARLLLDRLDGDTSPARTVILPTRLTVRGGHGWPGAAARPPSRARRRGRDGE